ncbi:MAG TPA: N-acetylmuramoyl-L-alanine amidase [Patescibacteria group bacterium]|nr:N-acetylmuramoyl-L-alanine amidase [Patescibacteria group bacterium]
MKTGRASRFYVPALIAALAAATAFGSPGGRQAGRQQTVQDRYQHAQQLEAALEVQPGGTRTEAGYLKVIGAYRKVAQLSATPLLAAPSLAAIGRLYDEMGHLFDTHYFRKSLDTYQYLLRVYPHAREAPEALYSIAQLQSGPLEDPRLARKSLESLVTLYPSSDQADSARLTMTDARHAAGDASGHPVASQTAIASHGNDRVTGSRLSMKPVEGGEQSRRLTLVRTVATEQIPDATRILVYLNGPVKFRSARIHHPDRVYFDLSRAYLVHPHGMRLSVQTGFVNTVDMAQNQPHVVRVVLDIHRGDGYTASLLKHPYRLAIDVGRLARGSSAAIDSGAGSAASAAAADRTAKSRAGSPDMDEELLTKGNLTPARPTHSGATSLTRALGLKIDRIVIDPGHGGFDTGSIGPKGVEEKTVCLEIARRLGRLIRRRLPGTQVIYTRDSDRFVPLEERTAIANEKKADLFISIHANSSTDPAARGVEVYYLNFTTSPEAIAVAARENALAQVPVHRLRDLLKEISLNDKIEESREFAFDVDHSLVQELRLAHAHTENRGVKKAPFVVLIGAHMPSILVEVSFLSNPTDEHLLEESRYRQRIALGLFDGIKRYLSSLNSLTFNEAKSSPATQR